MSPRQKLLVAIVAGAVLAGPPVAALNLWLNGLVERQGQEEIDVLARRTIVLAEGRIGRAIDALGELAARGIDSCRNNHIEALRQATFTVTPVKEFSVLAADGRTLCANSGPVLEARQLISSEPAAAESGLLLEVIGIGDRPGQWVRIRRTGSGAGNGLAALIPSESLIISMSSQAGPLSTLARMRTRGGTVIGQAGTMVPASGSSPPERLVATLASERYALTVTVSMARANVAVKQADMRALGTVASGMFAILILLLSLILTKRVRGNPVVEIERALRAREFVPYYHPIVDIRSGRLRGAEVLARWRRKDGAIVPPASFIPLAESTGLIVELTRDLMRRVCEDLGPALAKRPQMKVSFNLTAQHFADEQIVHDARKIFGKSSPRLSQVVFEVTERQPLENLTETRRVIAALQGLGVRIAIDDVGTGHSGLSYMLKLGVDIIKIDKMFVDSLGTDHNSNTIVETLIDLARNMRMEVIAEGVESFEQVIALRDLGIRAAQGYVFAPPLPASAFLQLVEAIDPIKQEREPEPVPVEGAPARFTA